eukprot:TRINITY_DN566_c0_g1_i1.p1 TRINITY_DN566_c0_g1~~TRINITY_DN566_c0_g1_i1.p1  ORF type:complete len:331 (+),score=86.49 TRINITY_DN566_c0_g1_i1:117-1109(+)
MTIKIFFTGATGYIGGTILDHLLRDSKDYQITALVRTPEQAKKIETLGVKTLLGSYDDVEIIKEAASKSDVVIDTASADHPIGAQALVDGLRIKAKEGGKRPIFIHTSGTGVLIDLENPGFGQVGGKIYSDDKAEDFSTLPDTRWHRNVDQIVEAGSDAIDTIIVIPPTIWGVGTGQFSTHSQQIPFLINSALQNKQVYQVGNGKNIWHHIHVVDLADLYLTLLKAALKGEAPLGADGYYLAENGHFEWGQIATAAAKKLEQHGLGDGTAHSTTLDNYRSLFIDRGVDPNLIIGSNSRGVAIKGRKLGWSPKHTELFESVAEEVDYYLKQ